MLLTRVNNDKSGYRRQDADWWSEPQRAMDPIENSTVNIMSVCISVLYLFIYHVCVTYMQLKTPQISSTFVHWRILPKCCQRAHQAPVSCLFGIEHERRLHSGFGVENFESAPGQHASAILQLCFASALRLELESENDSAMCWSRVAQMGGTWATKRVSDLWLPTHLYFCGCGSNMILAPCSLHHRRSDAATICCLGSNPQEVRNGNWFASMRLTITRHREARLAALASHQCQCTWKTTLPGYSACKQD